MIPALAAAVWLGLSTAYAQFGQNHVVIKDFDWRVRSTEHFDIYYYTGSEKLVPEAAEILERGFRDLTGALDISTDPPPWLPSSEKKYRSWKRRPFFLYASPNDFEQSNISQPGDGTGGITEPFKDRFMVYNDGTYQWLDEVTTHEQTHIMQFHILVNGFWRSGRILKTIVYPLWMMEGMPSFYTHHIESNLEEYTIRDAATSGGLIPLTRLEHFGHLKPHQITLAYKEGGAAMRFLADQYGRKKVGEMLRLFESRLETSQVLAELIGLDAFQFDAKFREYTETKYAREIVEARLREPEAFGMPLTRTKDTIPQFNTAPVFTPDGKSMYYLTTSAGHPPELREMDLATGRFRKLANINFSRIENVPMGNFANLSRVLAITRDGRKLAISGTKNHRDALMLYDLEKRRLEVRPLPEFQQVSRPAFSPDGGQIVFSGMKDGSTDLYLYDVRTRGMRRLTEDARDDDMPYFTPDGGSIVWSAEVEGTYGRRTDERRLYRLDLRSGEVKRLENCEGQARDPVVSDDGKRVLFNLRQGGFDEMGELDLATGRVRRMTRVIGGAFSPAYAPGQELAFATLRRGNVHIYKGPRADFLNETVPSNAEGPADSEKFMLPGMGGVAPSSSTVALSDERPYKFQYSTDLFLPAFFYSSEGGFFWTSYWQGSDLLGNHQNAAIVAINGGHSYDYQGTYAYQRFRPAMFAGASGTARKDLLNFDDDHTIDDAYHTQFAGTAFPFDRYHRIELALHSATENYDDRTDPTKTEHREARYGSVGLVRDTSRGRYLVVTQGSRLRLDYSQAAEVLGGNRAYTFLSAEAHEFVPLGAQSTLALKSQVVGSYGPDRQEFGIGGLGRVRGYGTSSNENVGTKAYVGTAELRFPLVREINYYMWYFFPDFYFKSLFGSIFTDVGYAWHTEGDPSRARLTDLRNSVGVGMKIYTFVLQEFPLIVAFDYAHRTTQNGGIFYVYLGQLF